MWWYVTVLFTLLIDSEGLLWQNVLSFLSKGTQSSPSCSHVDACRQSWPQALRLVAPLRQVMASILASAYLSLRPGQKRWLNLIVCWPFAPCIQLRGSILSSHQLPAFKRREDSSRIQFDLFISANWRYELWHENYWSEYLQKTRGKSCFTVFL